MSHSNQDTPHDTVIARVAIHPGIGVARIGDSQSEFFIGPEIADPPASKAPPSCYRDKTGAIKRQAARFRLYGYNAAGEVVRELTADHADITWTVHLVNRKAQWFQFQYALDIPEAVDAPDNAFPLRNPTVQDRAKLVIDPGPRSISGRPPCAKPSYPAFDSGTFQAVGQKPVVVPLGEIRTDEQGRLLVLGGVGKSASPTGAPVFDPDHPPSFNNADDWYDDTSDGPVTAKVSINGIELPVESAWVIVAPPNYAPDIVSWRTMHDLMTDVFVQSGQLQAPETPSFSRDILPILNRLSRLGWVNQGFAAYFGKGRPMDFENPDFIAKLAHRPVSPQAADPYAELRRAIYHCFRPPRPAVCEPVTWPHIWPWIYGDTFGSFPEDGTGNMLPMTGLQDFLLSRWVEGQFVADWPAAVPSFASIDEVPLCEQPQMLDKAAMHYCLADTFHPGCEMTWPMRHATLYAKPFRIRQRAAEAPEPDYGSTLTPAKAQIADGPLYAQRPGDLTRWMGLPWQSDTAFCRSGYDPEFDPYLPTFWAARVPNQVLTEEDYRKAVDPHLERSERIAAYNRRQTWLRGIQLPDTVPTIKQMIEHFGQLGIITVKPGVRNDPDIPEYLYVETLTAGDIQKAAMKAASLTETAPQALTNAQKAGWISQEQIQAFRAVRVRRS